MREYHSICCDDDAYISHFGISKNKVYEGREENLSKTSFWLYLFILFSHKTIFATLVICDHTAICF
jgi:hypothetical protein